MNIILLIICNICFVCSKESSHCDVSFEYSQHMFWLRNKKIILLVRTLNYRHELMIISIQGILSLVKVYILYIFHSRIIF